jgi:hypothetical protein
MSGVDLAKEIRRQRPNLAIVLTSGGYSSALAAEGTHGFELIHKPYSIAQFKTLGQQLNQPESVTRFSGRPQLSALVEDFLWWPLCHLENPFGENTVHQAE